VAVNVVAFKGVEGDQQIWAAGWSFDNPGPRAIPGANSSHGPALAVFNGRLFMAWRHVEGERPTLFLNTFDGEGIFTQPQPIIWQADDHSHVIASNRGPALATFNNRLFMARKGSTGDEGDQRIHSAGFDGTSWTAPRDLGSLFPFANSSHGPALAVWDGQIQMAWRGVEGNQPIWWANFDGTSWTTPATIPGANSSHGPALVRVT